VSIFLYSLALQHCQNYCSNPLYRRCCYQLTGVGDACGDLHLLYLAGCGPQPRADVDHQLKGPKIF